MGENDTKWVIENIKKMDITWLTAKTTASFFFYVTPWFDVEVLHAPVRKDSVACNDAESPLMFAPFPDGRAHVKCHESEADCTIGTCVRQLATLARTESIVQPRRLRDPGMIFIYFRWCYFSWFHNLLWRPRYLLNVCSSLRGLEVFSNRLARSSKSHCGLLLIFAGVGTSEQTDLVRCNVSFFSKQPEKECFDISISSRLRGAIRKRMKKREKSKEGCVVPTRAQTQ